FSPVTVPKIKKACEMRSYYQARFDIGVDGAVGLETVPEIVKAGANYLIAGSSVFNKSDTGKNIQKLRKLAEKTLIQYRNDFV
ncbi:MAG: hypothetical protein ACOC7U_09150, partial [Spirochaetota bacterium]